jgi:CpeT protein
MASVYSFAKIFFETNMHIMKNVLLILFAFCLACSASAQVKLAKDDLQVLQKRMTGLFSSRAQSQEDSSYYEIALHMEPIWPDNKDGYWFYVEQAMARMLDKPYRQRIYHLTRQDKYTLVSKVYELPQPMRFAGAWKNKSLLAGITVDSLIDRQGCAIYLKKDDAGNYSGSTPGKECLSSLRGATYATSEVVIYADRMISWDRGWDKENKQVWGATKGGYRFVRITE